MRSLKHIVVFVASFFLITSINASPQPRYVPGVTSIIYSHEYLRANPAKTYWKISPYYLPQPTDSSCSATAATMVLNAARIPQMLYANQKLATVESVVHSLRTNEWADDVKSGGNGVTLDEAAQFIAQAFKAYGFKNASIEAVHANDSKAFSSKLHQALVENEQNAEAFIIINFNQKFISGTESVGHFAPIGAYNAKERTVLIMDPDRELFEPYWMPEDLLVNSMQGVDSDAHKTRGYLLIKPNGAH